MRKIFVEPFTLSWPAARKIIAIAMLVQTLMAGNYQLLPFLFYRPTFYCDTPLGLQVCHEIDACQQLPIKYKSEYTFSSIPQEFNFYCENKKNEATMLTLMMVGHLLGAFCSVFLADMGRYQHKALMVILVGSAVSGASCVICGITTSVNVLTFFLTLWSLSSETILNFLCMLPSLFFPPPMINRVFSLIVISWGMYSAVAPFLIRMHLSWRVVMVCHLGIPHLIWCFYVCWKFKELSCVSTTQMQHASTQLLPRQEIKAQQVTPLEDGSQQYIGYEYMYRSCHFRNIMLFLVIYGGSYVASITSLLTLGTLSGNIYFNMVVMNLIEISLSIIGGFVIQVFSVQKSLKVIFFTMALSYSVYNLVPEMLQNLIIIEGKLLTDATWIVLNTYSIMIVPPRYIPLLMSTKGIYNITVCIFMPYIKYFMESIRLNIFVFSGAYEFISYISIRAIRDMDLSKD